MGDPITLTLILYGELKDKAENPNGKTGSIETLNLEVHVEETVEDILYRLEIDEKEVSHIFLNHEYSDVKREVKDGDRLALFPRDMALLYKWYFSRKK